jgi:hypothetical protein
MNERIKELAIKAGWSEDIRYAPRAKEIEKFAELIVQECVGVADHSNVTGKSIVGERIKQHFGVEE